MQGDKAGKLAGLAGKYVQQAGEHSEINFNEIKKVKGYKKLLKAKNHSYEFPKDLGVNLDNVVDPVFPESSYQRQSPRLEGAENKTAHRNSASDIGLSVTEPTSLSLTETRQDIPVASTTNIFAALKISPRAISQSLANSIPKNASENQPNSPKPLNNSRNTSPSSQDLPTLEPEDNNVIITPRKSF